jgi:hypothetical protein
MCSLSGSCRLLTSFAILMLFTAVAAAQRAASRESEFGPVMTAYLGYLHNEQEVVDDRASRREISTSYYRRNSNRIHALRLMATRLVRESGNDYVPELEAVTVDEFGTIFERRPKPSEFRQNQVVANKFRYLGPIQTGETFYLFARLDPYEQAELLRKESSEKAPAGTGPGPNGQRVGDSSTRVRRVIPR